jgi:hypothetical protein
MVRRSRTNQPISLKERLALFSKGILQQAEALPDGPERDELLKKVKPATTAQELEAWANSPGLQPPK